jgi:hypothetical protein
VVQQVGHRAALGRTGRLSKPGCSGRSWAGRSSGAGTKTGHPFRDAQFQWCSQAMPYAR